MISQVIAAVLVRKFTASQVVKRFPAFYGTWIFIIVFTRDRHCALSYASAILILSSRLCLALSGSLRPSDFLKSGLHVASS
jgi:hypothetical protein